MLKHKLLSLDFYIDRFAQMLTSFIPRLIIGIIILLIGISFIKLVRRFSKRIIEKRGFEPTASGFISDVIDWFLKLILFIIVFVSIGVNISTFVAAIGAMGLAIGLALQGSLSNFAGGVLIVMFKPFKVGDYISVQGQEGTVLQIQILITKIVTLNNQIIYIPNSSVSNGTIINYSESTFRRADLSVGVGYASDLKQVTELIFKVLNENPLVIKDPIPTVWVSSLCENSIIFSVRPWSKNEDFLQMKSEVLEQIKLTFDQNKIEIPFPQRVVHISK